MTLRSIFLLSLLSGAVALPTVAAEVAITFKDTSGAALSDAVAYLVPNDSSALPQPRDVTIDQVDRNFVPLVSVIQTGASVAFPNSDNIRHQVYSFSPAKVFNLKLYSGKPSNPVVFDRAGAVVLGCNIHDQMIAWVLVVDTPWFAKSNVTGKATIKGIPDGDYTLKLWHPGQRKEAAEQSLRIAGNSLEREVVLDAEPISTLSQHHMAGH